MGLVDDFKVVLRQLIRRNNNREITPERHRQIENLMADGVVWNDVYQDDKQGIDGDIDTLMTFRSNVGDPSNLAKKPDTILTYEPGTFINTANKIVVKKDGRFYELQTAEGVGFVSSDFAAELLNGDWLLIGGENEAEVETDINWSISHHYHTLTANKTFTFSNVGERKAIRIAVIQGAGNSFTVTFPTVDWGVLGGPTQRAGGGGGITDVYYFTEINGVVYGSYDTLGGVEVPLATDTVAGRTKIYDTLGDDIDGAATRRLVTEQILGIKDDIGVNYNITETYGNTTTSWESLEFAEWGFGFLPASAMEVGRVNIWLSRVNQNDRLRLRIYRRPAALSGSTAYAGTAVEDELLQETEYPTSNFLDTGAVQECQFDFLFLNTTTDYIYLFLVRPLLSDNSNGVLGAGRFATSDTLLPYQRGYYNLGSIVNAGAALARTVFRSSSKLEEIDEIAEKVSFLETQRSDLYQSLSLDSFEINGLNLSIQLPFVSANLVLDATQRVTGATFTGNLIYNASDKSVYGTHLQDSGYSCKNVLNVVVRRASDNELLARFTDYRLFEFAGTISGLQNVSSFSVNVVFDYDKERVDIIQINPATSAITVVKGMERNLEAHEEPYRPVATQVVLGYAVVRGSNVNFVPAGEWEGLIRAKKEGEFARAVNIGKRNLSKTLRKLENGIDITIAGYGDSIIAHQSAAPGFAANGANRDRTNYLTRISPDFLATIPLYDFGDGAGQVHTKVSYMWHLKDFIEDKYGVTITYNNYGIGSTNSSSTTNNGLDPNRISVIVADAPDLCIVGFGMNEVGGNNTYTNIKNIINQLKSVGTECIVMGCPRPNSITEHSNIENLRKTNNQLKRAALDTNSAFVPTLYYTENEQVGFFGMDQRALCSQNIFNHPGIWELKKYGEMLTMFF
jgi:hypothetical protein